MKLTDYFLPLKKDKPKEAEITSHILMLRSGMCQQSTSGIYSWLPLGKKVLDKIEKVENLKVIKIENKQEDNGIKNKSRKVFKKRKFRKKFYKK